MLLNHYAPRRAPSLIDAVLTALLVFAFTSHGLALSAAVQVQGDAQTSVTFAAPPQRIVSLLPALTETVCALGQCAKLVAVDRYSNFPEAVKKLPQVGGGMDPHIEAIARLRPDVVLMAASSRAHERFTALGIPVLLLEPKTLSDVRRTLMTIGQLLGLPPAQALHVWQGIQTGLAQAARTLPVSAKNANVYFEVDSAPYAAGEASFMGELLQHLGAKNIVPTAMGAFPMINPEFVVRANPDVIMVGDANVRVMAARPGWAAIKAIRDGKVCAFEREQSDILVRAGPRLVEAAQLMAQCLAGQRGRWAP